MNDRSDLTTRLGAAFASRSSRRGFFKFAGMAAIGLGVGLHGAPLAWADSCAGCGSTVCGCGQAGNCCLAYPDGSCGTYSGTYACNSSGCDTRCTMQSWTCCSVNCRWICAECCCNGNGCSCAVKGTVDCGGGRCAQAPEKAA